MKLLLFLSTLVIVLLVLGKVPSTLTQNVPVVQISSGKVSGRVMNVASGGTVFLYQGIRYAHAPRFEAPRAATAWSDVYNGNKGMYSDVCPQFNGKNEAKNEDCLVANVWTPSDSKTNRSVMIWIHGGGLTEGSGDFSSQHLVHDGGVIVVGINYRLGPLGFLAGLGVPGNLGLRDQLFGLKWIQDNIHAFGGNPKDVTIFGESAGAMSVGALILSPLAKGLFHRVIMQSGAPNGVTDSKLLALSKAKSFASHLKCPTDNDAEAAKCLKKASLLDVQKAGNRFQFVYGDDVLPLNPVDALKKGQFNHVDLIFGVNDCEGSYFVLNSVHNSMTVQSVHDQITSQMGKDLADFYTSRIPKSNPTQDQIKRAIAQAFGDRMFVCPEVLFGEEMGRQSAGNNQLYSYRLMQNFENHSEFIGVPHTTDLGFLTDVQDKPQHKSDAAGALSKDMISAWTSFAKTGHPGKMGAVEWTQAFDHSASNFHTQFMYLDSTKYHMVKDYYSELCDKLWKPKIF